MRIRSAGQLIVAAALTAGALTGVSPAGATPSPEPAVAAATVCKPIDQASITRLYSAYFLRAPDAGGLAYWTDIIRTRRADLGHIATLFADSNEFRHRYANLDNRGFVYLVYNNVMARQPDTGGLNYWTNLLNAGHPRGAIMIGFSESPEYMERSGILPSPPAANDPKIAPTRVPVTMHPARSGEFVELDPGGVTHYYLYSQSVSFYDIWDYTAAQFPCPGWTLVGSDNAIDANGVFFAVKGPNGYIVEFLIIDVFIENGGYYQRVAYVSAGYAYVNNSASSLNSESPLGVTSVRDLNLTPNTTANTQNTESPLGVTSISALVPTP
jgi:hypothetical protein